MMDPVGADPVAASDAAASETDSEAGSDTEPEATDTEPAATDSEPSCGGVAPVLGVVAATPSAFASEGGVQVDDDGVIGATVGTSLGWVTLAAEVSDADADLHAWTMRVWLAPAETPLDATAPPVGEVTGGGGAPCDAGATTAEVVLAVDDVLLAPATDYHALIAVVDAAGQQSPPVEVGFTTPE
jgi:hypothetical protein